MKILNHRFLSSKGATTAALALSLFGCTKNTAAQDASNPPSASEPEPGATSADLEHKATVQISAAFRQRCNLAEDAQAAPEFAFDQATLHMQGKNVLDDVASCLIDGPLKSEEITIIGRTDAHGTAGHNEDLGKNRAVATRSYLVQKGVPSDRIHIMSRGEKGARGDNDTEFALDRRVDLELGDLKNSPILEGSMLQAETAPAPKKTKAATYSDTGDGPVGASVTGPGSAAGAK